MVVYTYLALLLWSLSLIGLFLKRDLTSMVLNFQVMFMAMQILLTILSKRMDNMDGQVFVMFSVFLGGIQVILGVILVTNLMRMKNKSFHEEIALKND